MRALSNPHPLLGNGQHIPVAGLVLAAALFSVQFFEPPAPTKSLADASSNDRAQVLVAKEQFCEFSGMLYIYTSFLKLHVCCNLPVNISPISCLCAGPKGFSRDGGSR